MKTRTWILIIGMATCSLPAFAQVEPEQNKQQSPGGSSVIKKGYFAIGNNAKKVEGNSATGVQVNTGTSTPVSKKGYYAIGKKRKAESSRDGAALSDKEKQGKGKRTHPVITKGYYSIGRNSEKLN